MSSEGCEVCAVIQVSLKSSQRTMVAMLNAAVTGSSTNPVPGTRAPCSTVVPGTVGPSNRLQSGWSSASSAHPRLSIKQ